MQGALLQGDSLQGDTITLIPLKELMPLGSLGSWLVSLASNPMKNRCLLQADSDPKCAPLSTQDTEIRSLHANAAYELDSDGVGGTQGFRGTGDGSLETTLRYIH